MAYFEVQTLIYGQHGDAWENTWSCDGVPETFSTRDEAEQAIKDHICDCINAVEGGHMDDSPDPADFRVHLVPDKTTRAC